MNYPAPVNWRLFEWKQGDWDNPAALWTGKYQDYRATISRANNTEYTWEISWPIATLRSSTNFQNETGAMLSADVWLYKRLNPMESK